MEDGVASLTGGCGRLPKTATGGSMDSLTRSLCDPVGVSVTGQAEARSSRALRGPVLGLRSSHLGLPTRLSTWGGCLAHPWVQGQACTGWLAGCAEEGTTLCPQATEGTSSGLAPLTAMTGSSPDLPLSLQACSRGLPELSGPGGHLGCPAPRRELEAPWGTRGPSYLCWESSAGPRGS